MAMTKFLKGKEPWRWATLVVLLIFVAGSAVLVAQHERARLWESSKERIENELDIMGLALSRAFLREDYSTIEDVITQWGQEHGDGSLVSLNVTSAEGRVLGKYNRGNAQKDQAYYVSREVRHNGELLMKVETIRDFTSELKAVKKLQWNFALAAASIVIALWISIQYIAYITLHTLQERIRELEKQLRNQTAPRDAEGLGQRASYNASASDSA